MNAPTVVAEGGHKPFEAPGLWLFQWKPLFHVGPVAVTKPMVLSVFVAVLVLLFFWAAFRKPQLVPRGMQNLGELGYLFIRDQIARPVIGKKGDKYVPLLISLFFLIWIMNILEVAPVAQFPVTSHIAFPIVFAVSVWVLMVFLYIKHQGPGFLKNVMFPPGLPWWIYPLLGPIELLSTFVIRPFTHAVRLFANMFAGHILVALFSIAAWYFLVENLGKFAFVGVVGFAMTVVLVAFELLIQFLQAFIFTILTASYISGALEAEH